MSSMKSLRDIKQLSQLGLFLLICLSLVSCDPEGGLDEETAQQIAFQKLSGAWTLNNGAGSIVVDGTDVSANYAGFALSFTNGGYTTTNADQLFRATGTWEWIDREARMIRLDDGKELTIVTLNEFRFTFTFNFVDGGVRAGIPGNYTISVVK